MKTATHPSGQVLQFDPEPHRYSSSGIDFVSVTTLVKRQFPQFDAAAVATKKAARDGVTAQSLLDAWDKARDEAAAFGNRVHAMAENIILSGEAAADAMPGSAREAMYLAAIKLAILRLRKNFEIVSAEMMVFAPVHGVAGTIDLLLKSRATGAYVIGDWKTSKEIRHYGFRGETGHGRCAHLQNCNFIHYSLQLAVYREILVSQGYLPSGARVGSAIIHLSDDGARASFESIATKDLAREARNIIALAIAAQGWP
jgi:ATP-dependent exoDNAse (exonuclease V) beta subunit